MTTTLSRAEREARVRHPSHVRTESILHPADVGLPTQGGEDQASSRIESGWMSIFAPVSLAASRAFWPSFPIARDSW
jgi:hypothetical protein